MKTGDKIGRWTVIGSGAGTRVECLCDCGTVRDVWRAGLVNGASTSCGCYGKARRNTANTTHGEAGSKLYRVWNGMRARCFNQNTEKYKTYGARGISVCEGWRHEFTPFRDWARSNGYADGLEIDRIDNDGDYAPTNCRWVSRKTNMRNKSNNRLIVIGGEAKLLCEWAEAHNLPRTLIGNRYHKLGWRGLRLLSPRRVKK